MRFREAFPPETVQVLDSGNFWVMGKLRNFRYFARDLLCTVHWLVLGFALAWISVGLSVPCTPVGTHCPTADVQLISAPVKDCCGHVVAYQTRKPQLGDKQFVQCRCAEKHSSQQQMLLSERAPSLTLMAPNALTLQAALLPVVFVTHRELEAGVVERAIAPFIPPPSVA